MLNFLFYLFFITSVKVIFDRFVNSVVLKFNMREQHEGDLYDRMSIWINVFGMYQRYCNNFPSIQSSSGNTI